MSVREGCVTMRVESRLTKTFISGLVIAIACISTACTEGRVHEFSVDPYIVCPGGQVTLRWRTEGGSVVLTRSIPGGGSSTTNLTPVRGEQTFTVDSTTIFSIRVGTGSNPSGAAQASVEVVTSVRNLSVGSTPSCEGRLIRTGGSLMAILPSSLHSMVVTGVNISTPNDRDVTVTYGGRVFTGRGGTDRFNGMDTTSGNWLLSAPLLGNEECPGTASSGTASGSTPAPQAPSSLSINVSLACPPRSGGPGGGGMTGTGGCGGMGQPCCSGSCNSGLECRSGTCQPGGMTGDRTCGGNPVGATTQPFEVGVRDPYGCAAIITAHANSREEAEECVRSRLAPGQTIVSAPATLGCYQVVFTSPLGASTRQVFAFSEEDARGCARSLCPVDCTSIVLEGACP
jgi:hypothetical protein